MSFNPFNEKSKKIQSTFSDWNAMYPKAYDCNSVDPFTKLRIILMNGTEFEAVWNSHQFFRHCSDNGLRRELALIRRSEQQQQKRISALKPIAENILETTIAYEQLAVDLTAILAAREKNKYVKQALDFALLEDFDHLYRYADLMEMEQGKKAEKLVGDYTEIMPGRPTISEHRFPFDDVKRHTDFKTADPITKLNVGIIIAAEQQTMNYYMNVGTFYSSDLGRKLYSEIALIEEQHVTHYGSLTDTNCTWLESLLMHEYTECYLYYSCMESETDPNIKRIWAMHLDEELAHLQKAAQLLENYEHKEWNEVIPCGEFPELLTFHSNKEYIRNVLKKTVGLTADMESYKEVSALDDKDEFFAFQKNINKSVKNVPSHAVIDKYIKEKGEDYRFEVAPHPVKSLRDRTVDNVDLAR